MNTNPVGPRPITEQNDPNERFFPTASGISTVFPPPPSDLNRRLTDEELQELIENPLFNAPFKEEQKLKRLEEEARLVQEIKKQESQFLNLSFHELSTKISDTFIGVINDLFTKPDSINLLNHIYIAFTKEDRLIYIGIIMIIITVVSRLVQK